MAMLCGACAARVPPPGVPVVASRTATDSYAAVLDRENTIRTLRARFVATAVQGGEKRAADGVLLVKRPARVRMRLLSPFGLTLLDYTSVDGQTRLVLPLEDKVETGTASTTDGTFSPADIGRLLLRAAPGAADGCTPRADGARVVVDCDASSGALSRRMTIDPGTATVAHEVYFADGKPRVSTDLSDYRLVDGVALPFSIVLTYPERDLTMRVEVRSYEVNPVLDDRLFDAGGGR